MPSTAPTGADYGPCTPEYHAALAKFMGCPMRCHERPHCIEMQVKHTLVCAEHKAPCHYNYQIDPSFQVKCDHCGKQAVRGEMVRLDIANNAISARPIRQP